jgi:hypothetical protein
MARRVTILACFLFSLSALAMATPCERPRFSGDVYAAGIRDASFGEAVVYWVFDRNAFTEYVYFTLSGETKLIASGRYTKLESGYRIEIPHTRVIGGPRQSAEVTEPVAHEFGADEAGVILPHGNRLVRVVDSAQWIPEVQFVNPALRTGVTSSNDTCCCACWSVHSFLGIEFLNGICCFFAGGCSDASGFCGSGGGSEW